MLPFIGDFSANAETFLEKLLMLVYKELAQLISTIPGMAQSALLKS